MAQRADIQGLRAIAVLLVIFYHYDLGLSGGYLGVDVFFVISGYVIALSALRDIREHKTFNWKRFYRRRIRRLLPGIAVVAVVTAFASLFALSPFGPQQKSATMLLSSALYSSNFVLLKSDYFSLDPSSNPLLHFWSLAVEEQFYFIWGPIVIAVLAITNRWHSKLVARGLVVVGLVTLVVSLVLFVVLSRYETTIQGWGGFSRLTKIGISPSSLAFYLPITRAWEFMCGAFLAMAHVRWKHDKTNINFTRLWTLSAIILVASAVLWASKLLIPGSPTTRAFNEYAVVLVVLGTMAFIHAGHESSFISQLLGSRLPTYIGDLSYSLYLWHWPIWTMFIVMMDKSATTTALALVVTALFSVVQYEYIEQPIRSGAALTKASGVHFIVAFVVVAAVGWAAINNLSPVIGKHLLGITPKDIFTHVIEQPCKGKFLVIGEAKSCLYAADNPKGIVILVGDSTAKSLSDGFIYAAKKLNQDALVFNLAGCAFHAPNSPFSPNCDGWRNDVWSVIRVIRPNVVVVSNLNILYTEDIGIPRTPTARARLRWGEQIQNLFIKIRATGARPLLVQPVPKFSFDIRYDITLLNRKFVSEPRNVVLGRTDLLNEIEEQSVGSFASEIGILNLDSQFCNQDSCSQIIDGKLAYEEPSHLSSVGSLKMSTYLESAMARLISK